MIIGYLIVGNYSIRLERILTKIPDKIVKGENKQIKVTLRERDTVILFPSNI